MAKFVFGPAESSCNTPNCPICRALPGTIPAVFWTYQNAIPAEDARKAVMDFSNGDWSSTICGDPDCSVCGTSVVEGVPCDCNDCDECNDRPLSNTERVTDLEIEVQNLRAAVLDLTKVVEYLLIWTGKKGNKQDRDKYLDGYIDVIRAIV